MVGIKKKEVKNVVGLRRSKRLLHQNDTTSKTEETPTNNDNTTDSDVIHVKEESDTTTIKETVLNEKLTTITTTSTTKETIVESPYFAKKIKSDDNHNIDDDDEFELKENKLKPRKRTRAKKSIERKVVKKKKDEEKEVTSPYFAKQKIEEKKEGSKSNRKRSRAKRSIDLNSSSMICTKIEESDNDEDNIRMKSEKMNDDYIDIVSSNSQKNVCSNSEKKEDNSLNIPYFVEEARSGRATCKGCWETIKKNELRVGYAPLFRGKPGFTIYKHLKCMTFPSSIQCIEDIWGYETLSEDTMREEVAQQICVSQLENEKQQKEYTPDELVTTTYLGKPITVPSSCTAKLLPFQQEGVSWMVHQETQTANNGGILADEMGMGKTLQTIVTILHNKTQLQHSLPGAKYPPNQPTEILRREESKWDTALEDWKKEMDMNDVPSSLYTKNKKCKSFLPGGARAGTLIICPVIALSQWKNEIEKFTKPNSLTVAIYHGTNRSILPRELLCKYDIVLTTYQVLEAEFRSMISPSKVTCPNCFRKFKVSSFVETSMLILQSFITLYVSF